MYPKIKTISKVITQNINKKKNTGQILIWQQIPKFKNIKPCQKIIRISQLIAKILLKQQSSNQIRICLTDHNQI